MPFVAKDPHQHLGGTLDTGHCMRHVQIVAGVPHSSKLRRGAKVRDSEVPRGTVIGTFHPKGHYTNATDGSAHVAIFLEKRPEGIAVVDCWVGQPVAERVIQYRNGRGKAVNDADRFHVVEEVDTT